jgi:glycosyltransferase involved in cell wall biosynthesis
MMERVLILTHSDPTTDSRILKTHEVASSGGRKTLSVGVLDPESLSYKSSRDVVVLRNLARKIRDKVLRKPQPGSLLSKAFFLLIYLELSIKMSIRGFIFRPQIIHCNDWFVLPIAVAVKILTGSKLIYDAHELESQTTKDPNFPSAFVFKVERTLWSFVDYFTTVSPSIDTWYQRELGPKPSEIILNSPILSTATLSDSASTEASGLRAKFDIPSSSVIYIYIGMLAVGRGIDIILEAFSKTKTDSVVVFLGYGNYREKIEQQGRQRKNVFVHDRVPHNQVVPLAKSADFGLCLVENISLSDHFCIPNKLLEYAFSGLPAVASKLPEIQRVVEEYKLGECFDNSAEQLLEVLEKNQTGEYVQRVEGVNLEALGWQAQAFKLESVFRHVSDEKGVVK